MLSYLAGPLLGLDMGTVLALSIGEGLIETLILTLLSERYVFRR